MAMFDANGFRRVMQAEKDAALGAVRQFWEEHGRAPGFVWTEIQLSEDGATRVYIEATAGNQPPKSRTGLMVYSVDGGKLDLEQVSAVSARTGELFTFDVGGSPAEVG